MIDHRLAQANGRLKAARMGVSIEQSRNRLCLRATLPPRPGSGRARPFQQRIFLGLYANPAGIKAAENEARKISALLACKEFRWEPYLKYGDAPKTVGEWVERFQEDYFERRPQNPKSETTWAKDYMQVFKRLPLDKPLTESLIRTEILRTKPNTRTRRRTVMALSALAKFAGIPKDGFTPLRGSYTPTQVAPRDLPTDKLIKDWFHRLPSGPWRWAYGMMATYGLRNHEIFHLDLEEFPVIQVTEGKTGSRRVWPFYPDWPEIFQLDGVQIPQCTGRNNSELGNRITHAFKRLGVPFNPYDLRHAWAVRSLECGLNLSLAAQQMGHSAQVHSQLYHQWITKDVHQRAWEEIRANAARIQPP